MPGTLTWSIFRFAGHGGLAEPMRSYLVLVRQLWMAWLELHLR